MARIEGPKYTGALIVDLKDAENDLVDLVPNALKGARGAQEGLDGVLGELAHAIQKYGNDAEIHPAIYARVVGETARLERLSAKRGLLVKLLEVVDESIGQAINNREEDLSTIGFQAQKAAEKANKPELLAHFAQTIKYRSQIAAKAVETRRKNEEAKDKARDGEGKSGT